MITLKSPREIDLMRRAGQAVALDDFDFGSYQS